MAIIGFFLSISAIFLTQTRAGLIALAVGGTSIVAAVAVGAVDAVAKGTTIVKNVEGLLTATVGTATLLDGDFDVYVEYTELDVVTGNLTNV